MAQYTITYFDFMGGRGEDCRLALHLAGADFTDDRLKGNWPDRKPLTPFGALPVLEVEGKGQLGQSTAILAYLGRLHGLHPTDPWEAARHEAIMACVEDLRAEAAPSSALKDEDEKKKAREALAEGYMQRWSGCVERQIGGGPFLAGADISVADLKLFVAMNAYVLGRIDHIGAEVFSAFPKLTRLFEAVKAHPKVVAWYAQPH